MRNTGSDPGVCQITATKVRLGLAQPFVECGVVGVFPVGNTPPPPPPTPPPTLNAISGGREAASGAEPRARRARSVVG